MNKIGWYINRLSKMPLPEICHRLKHKLLQNLDRWFYSIKTPLPPSSHLDHTLLSRLTQHVTQPVLVHFNDRLKSSLVAQADQYLADTFDVFGIRTRHEKGINWHLDPKTGNQWPLEFWSRIDIRDGVSIGGVKFVWEINRLYCLPVLGMAYRLTEDRKYGEKIFQLLEDWLLSNPYPKGVNWTSGIELGIRVANLVWALSLLDGFPMQKPDKRLVNLFVQLHGYHLKRYPSKYSSNNNHALAEAFGLFLAGVFFPHLKGAVQWRTFGKEVLEREMGRQILADGGSYEYTTSYLSFTADFFLLYRQVCRLLGLDYDRTVDERLERSCEYIHLLMDSRGHMPNIGDQDSAVLVNFGLDNLDNFRSILNTGARIFNRPEFCRDASPDLKTCFLLGDAAVMDLHQPAVSSQSVLLEESGLSVIRSSCKGHEIIFVGNATPLGMPPLYAHGHLDAMSFTLSVGGREIFVDPGTYLYHCGGKWRYYFRSVAAHNTIRINTADFTGQPGPFMFGSPYRITEHKLVNTESGVSWQASHDAYQKLEEPVHLFRRVMYNSQRGLFSFEDVLDSPGDYFVEQFFHLHPDCHVTFSGREAMITTGKVRLHMIFDQQVQVKVYRGSHDPMAGWFSSSFNHLQPCSTMIAFGNFSGKTLLRTELEIMG